MTTQQPRSIKLDSFSEADDSNGAMKQASILSLLNQSSIENTTSNLHEIVLILGGGSQILRDYLSSTDMILTDDQLTQIQQILIRSTNAVTIQSGQSLEEHNDSQSITYTFNKNDTYYHSWFTPETATKIIDIIYHKYFIAITIFLCSGFGIWAFAVIGSSLVHQVCGVLLGVYLSTYFTAVMLTINKKVLKRSIGHFVFWFKILTSIQATILWFILRVIAIKDRELWGVSMFGEIFACFFLVITVFMYSAIDGLQLSRKSKLIFGVGLSIGYTIVAIMASGNTLLYGDQSTVTAVGFFQFSIASLYASSIRVLTIFLWKQTFLLWIKKDKCVNIRHSPYIKWV